MQDVAKKSTLYNNYPTCMQTYEVEIKTLLGSSERAQEVRDAMHALDEDCELSSRNKQLNHYFEGGTLSDLYEAVKGHLADDAKRKLKDIAGRAKEFSVRTRDKDNIVLLVVKASVGSDSSANGVSRIEFEAQVPLSLMELDEIVLSSGFTYQAKWSREREEYICKGITVCLDKNAGYGYVAEFEQVVEDSSKIEVARAQITALMRELKVDELPQDRLERMFAHYNKNWRDYYGTDKIFVIE